MVSLMLNAIWGWPAVGRWFLGSWTKPLWVHSHSLTPNTLFTWFPSCPPAEDVDPGQHGGWNCPWVQERSETVGGTQTDVWCCWRWRTVLTLRVRWSISGQSGHCSLTPPPHPTPPTLRPLECCIRARQQWLAASDEVSNVPSSTLNCLGEEGGY